MVKVTIDDVSRNGSTLVTLLFSCDKSVQVDKSQIHRCYFRGSQHWSDMTQQQQHELPTRNVGRNRSFDDPLATSIIHHRPTVVQQPSVNIGAGSSFQQQQQSTPNYQSSTALMVGGGNSDVDAILGGANANSISSFAQPFS